MRSHECVGRRTIWGSYFATGRTVLLTDERALDAARVGGKAAGLARAVRAGCRVPDARVLGVDAFRAFAREAGVADAIAVLESSLTTLPEQHSRSLARDIVAALRAVTPPAEVRAALRRARRELRPAESLICRSSGVEEDGAALSFAGVFRSVGSIRDDEALIAAAVACWCSLFEPRALSLAAHARSRGARAPLAMAIVIQQEVCAQAAGVAFTRDPLTGAHATVVEAVAGHAGDFVAGREAPWRYARQPGDAAWRLVGRPAHHDGAPGVVSGLHTHGPLTRDMLDAVAAACRRLARSAGSDADVEFAFDDRDMGENAPAASRTRQDAAARSADGARSQSPRPTPWILQCRPIVRARFGADPARAPRTVAGDLMKGAAGEDGAAAAHDQASPPRGATQLARARARARDSSEEILRWRGITCAAGIAVGRGVDPRGAPAEPDWLTGDERRSAVLLLERLTVEDLGLLFRCSAVVTERADGQLSHVAIACRELGVPYVSGIECARSRLHGQFVVVDGAAGVVAIVDPATPRVAGPTADAPADADMDPAQSPSPGPHAGTPGEARSLTVGIRASTPADSTQAAALDEETPAARVERLVLQALPRCSDLDALERHVLRRLSDSAEREDAAAHLRRLVEQLRSATAGPSSRESAREAAATERRAGESGEGAAAAAGQDVDGLTAEEEALVRSHVRCAPAR